MAFFINGFFRSGDGDYVVLVFQREISASMPSPFLFLGFPLDEYGFLQHMKVAIYPGWW